METKEIQPANIKAEKDSEILFLSQDINNIDTSTSSVVRNDTDRLKSESSPIEKDHQSKHTSNREISSKNHKAVPLPSLLSGLKGSNVFPAKLHAILTDRNLHTFIRFSLDGTSWSVLDKEMLEKNVFPIYFRHSKYTSFTRTVIGWGFKRVGKASYQHPLFRRDSPELCHEMIRAPLQKTRNNNRSITTESFDAARAIISPNTRGDDINTLPSFAHQYHYPTSILQNSVHEGCPQGFNNAPYNTSAHYGMFSHYGNHCMNPVENYQREVTYTSTSTQPPYTWESNERQQQCNNMYNF
mmetsp:Transcript_40048/g.78250  ORF Transcript_40048/g.78250 Transcript_40048/m.78250 type:complete len:298 (+) Transcript_40048:147-1040(+)